MLAHNQETGTTGSYTVTNVLVHLDPAQVHLTIGGEQIATTPEHPFYVLLRGWVAAIALRAGDQVRSADGDYGAVEAVRLDPTPRLMYNLTVAEAHTFFVGEEGWLVHNAGFCGPFPNQLPGKLATELALARKLGVKPIKGLGAAFEAAVNTGTIKWVITEAGELLVIPKFVQNQEIAHTVLTGGRSVLAAGEAEIAGTGGRYIGLAINYHSGHYMPSVESLQVGKDAFAKLGIIFN